MTEQPDLRTPDEWQQEMPDVVIYDPDGWRGRRGRPWTDPISREEYLRRRSWCTVGPLPLGKDAEDDAVPVTAQPGPDLPATMLTGGDFDPEPDDRPLRQVTFVPAPEDLPDSLRRACRAPYPLPATFVPNTRVIRCGRPAGHDGAHREDDTNVTWWDPPIDITQLGDKGTRTKCGHCGHEQFTPASPAPAVDRLDETGPETAPGSILRAAEPSSLGEGE